MVSPFNQVEVTRTLADATRFAISAISDAPNILRGNVYGRFVPVERGVYTLAESGRAALLRWPQLTPLTAVHQ